MITQGFYPLVAGLALTSLLIAYSDLKNGWMYWWHWLPAACGVSVFYVLSLNLPLLIIGMLTAGLMVAGSWATLRYVHKRNDSSALVGNGDYLAIGLFSFWPEMAVYSIVLALLFGIAGFQFKWWNRGLRGIPLAGLMGVFCLGYILWLALA